MRRCRLNGSDAQHCEDRSGVDPENRWRRFLRFTVSPDSETAALQCGRAVSTCHVLPAPDTWTRPPSLKSATRSCRRDSTESLGAF
jgi:hypothetical protein